MLYLFYELMVDAEGAPTHAQCALHIENDSIALIISNINDNNNKVNNKTLKNLKF